MVKDPTVKGIAPRRRAVKQRVLGLRATPRHLQGGQQLADCLHNGDDYSLRVCGRQGNGFGGGTDAARRRSRVVCLGLTRRCQGRRAAGAAAQVRARGRSSTRDLQGRFAQLRGTARQLHVRGHVQRQRAAAGARRPLHPAAASALQEGQPGLHR
jgi:hypothetical protein